VSSYEKLIVRLLLSSASPCRAHRHVEQPERTIRLVLKKVPGIQLHLDLPGKSGEHQLRNQEVFYGKREQADAGVPA
jgi:hypothetical protein